MKQHELSQFELVAWRLAGRLPHIDINGTDFTIDLRLRELRETESPWNRIDITDLEPYLDGDGAAFFYDTEKHNLYELDGNLTLLPENVLLVELPNEYILDPVAAARSVGFNEDRFLDEYPIQQKLIAAITQLEDTFLPKMIAENIQRSSENKGIPNGRIGR